MVNNFKHCLLKLMNVLYILISVLIFNSCTTTVSSYVVYTPYFDTSNITGISVKPFTSKVETVLGNDLAIEFTTFVVKRIIDSDFKYIPFDEITALQEDDNFIAYFTGEIMEIDWVSVKVTEWEKAYDMKSGTETMKWVEKEKPGIKVTFSYQLVEISSGNILGGRIVSGTQVIMGGHKVNVNNGLTNDYLKKNDFDVKYMYAELWAGYVAIRPLLKIAQDISPWTVKEKRELISDRTNDQRMKAGVAALKQGSYRSAISSLMSLYEDTGNFSAGFNAAIAFELNGNTREAIYLLQKIDTDTFDPKDKEKIKKELVRMEDRLLNEASLVQNYGFKTRDFSVFGIITQAANDLITKLPQQSHLSITNISSSDLDIVEFITEEISILITKTDKFKVLERKNLDIIRFEQYFQLSGDVDDESIVDIGKFLGTEIIIVCSITKLNNSQILRIKGLSVLTAEIIYQNSWRIE
jgi:hypothetical protein